jgi:hemerythrin-like domain-containing protein
MVVAAMEREVEALRSGEVHEQTIARMVEFTRGFTDGCHHAKEEKVLFPLLEQRSPQAGGPVSVMLSEHMAGRQAVGAIADGLPQARDSDAARAAVAANLALYAELLRLHINKENAVLFPLAERTLGGDDKRRLAEGFDRVEAETGEGEHERYQRLAHELGQGAAV